MYKAQILLKEKRKVMSLIWWLPLGAYVYICNYCLLNIVLCVGEKHEEEAAGWDGQSSHEKWCSSFHLWIWWSCFKSKSKSSSDSCRNCRTNRTQECVLNPWFIAIFQNYLYHKWKWLVLISPFLPELFHQTTIVFSIVCLVSLVVIKNVLLIHNQSLHFSAQCKEVNFWGADIFHLIELMQSDSLYYYQTRYFLYRPLLWGLRHRNYGMKVY